MRMRSLCLLTASLTTSPVAAFADPVRIISGERSVGARALANSGDGDEREDDHQQSGANDLAAAALVAFIRIRRVCRSTVSSGTTAHSVFGVMTTTATATIPPPIEDF